MNIGFKKLDDAAIPFKYARKGDACMDMYALRDVILEANKPTLVPTGIAVEIPEGYEGIVRGRSGYALYNGIFVHVGTIDSNYRGDVGVIMMLISNYFIEMYKIKQYDRIAQFSIHPVTHIDLIERELTKTERGNQGYGSSGT